MLRSNPLQVVEASNLKVLLPVLVENQRTMDC